VGLLIQAAVLHTRANLKVADLAGEDAERIAGTARAATGEPATGRRTAEEPAARGRAAR